jgi:hypothetical protein
MDPCIIVQFIKKIQQDATVYQNFIIPYLYEAQHVLGDTPPIIRSLITSNNLSHCLTTSTNYVQQPSMYEKPEAASAVLGS